MEFHEPEHDRNNGGKRTASVGVVAAALAATLVGITESAYAAGPGRSEACPSNSICLDFNSPGYNWGSFEYWSPGQYGDLGQFTFSNWGNGSGYGVNVGGNAAPWSTPPPGVYDGPAYTSGSW
ncbi:hypothetical protein [Kitasatospora sp. NBC_01266]|uniref:hypothetical protein n=1 Tax=Kitasatospora sp. NBC_01266 TaxID=2903572 RepID=UPI002E2FAA00|nr:hypothetical protein [Kitasatospora sp. NBC_01266]